MAFSSSFGTGYTIGSGMRDKRKAKKDLEGMVKMNSQFIENFLMPNLADEEQEGIMFQMQSIEDDNNLSLNAKAEALNLLSKGIGQKLVQQETDARISALLDSFNTEGATSEPTVPEALTTPTSSSVSTNAPSANFDMFSQEDIDQAYQKKNNLGSQGPVGSQGPAGPAGAPGPAGPPIEQFTDFSKLEDRLKVEPKDQNHKKELAMQGINAFGGAARDPKIRYDGITGHNYIEWTDTRKGSGERMKVDDFLSLGQVKKHLENNHQDILFRQKQEEVAFRQENADARNRAMQVAQRSSRPYTGRFAELQQGEAPTPTQAPAPVAQQQQAPANIAEINSEIDELKKINEQLPDSEGEISPALDRRDRAEAMIRNYFERAGSQASLAGLGSLIQTASALDAFINPAIEEGEPLNETHTEKLAVRQTLIDDLNLLKKRVIESDGNATGRVNTLIIKAFRFGGIKVGPEATQLEQAASRVANTLIKARSGAAVSAQEMERVMTEIGRTSMDDDDYLTMVDGLIADQKREYTKYVNSYAAMGYRIPSYFYDFLKDDQADSMMSTVSNLNQLNEAKKLLQQKQGN